MSSTSVGLLRTHSSEKITASAKRCHLLNWFVERLWHYSSSSHSLPLLDIHSKERQTLAKRVLLKGLCGKGLSVADTHVANSNMDPPVSDSFAASL